MRITLKEIQESTITVRIKLTDQLAEDLNKLGYYYMVHGNLMVDIKAHHYAWVDYVIIKPGRKNAEYGSMEYANNYSLFVFEYEPDKQKPFIPSKPIVTPGGMPICPICGSEGEDLVFSFYCFNPTCQNYMRKR